MRLRRGPSGFWAAMHRWKVARARMPFWRVVVESEFDRRARKWPERYSGAVTAVYVWARTIEEAEGLASLALEEEGLVTLTADAIKVAPAARPSREAAAVMRGPLGYIARAEDETPTPGPSRRDARA
jgi:hypothetical protein